MKTPTRSDGASESNKRWAATRTEIASSADISASSNTTETKRWGGAGVFFSRWLVTPLGPWINLASGAADYSWLRFTLWDFLGESFGAALFIWLGHVFSDRVQQIGSIFGDLTWAIVGALAAAFLGWKLFFGRGARSRL